MNNISPLFEDILERSELHTSNSSIPVCVTIIGVLGVMGQETSPSIKYSPCIVRIAVAFAEHYLEGHYHVK